MIEERSGSVDRVLDLGSKGHKFETYLRNCVMSFSKTCYPLRQPRKMESVQAFRFMVGQGLCPMISKYGPSLSKAEGPVDPSFIVVKKSHFN